MEHRPEGGTKGREPWGRQGEGVPGEKNNHKDAELGESPACLSRWGTRKEGTGSG